MPHSIPIKIFVVDDNAAQRFVIKESFESWDIINSVEEFATCEEALDNLQHREEDDLPDIVFLDRNFQGSGMQGDALVEILRTTDKFRYIKVAMMTADDSDIGLVDKYAAMGVTAFFDKARISQETLLAFMSNQDFKIQIVRRKTRNPLPLA